MMKEWYKKTLARIACNRIEIGSYPKAVHIETINSCNNTCSFCPMNIYSEETKKRQVVKMDDALYKKIIDELAGVKFSGLLKLYNGNEPLLDKRLPEFVRYAKEKLPFVRVIQIDTNAKLLTEELGKELIEAGINYFHVNDYTNNGEVGVNHKRESIKGIFDNLNRKFPKIKMIYLPRSMDEVLDSLGGQAPNKREIATKSVHASCVYPFYMLVITSNGKVGLCCVDSAFEEPLGNMAESTIAQIWKGKAFSEFRDDLSKGHRIKKLCSKCSFNSLSKDLFWKINNREDFLYSALYTPFSIRGMIK